MQKIAATTTQATCKEMFMNGLEPLSNKANRTIAWQTNQCDSLFCTNSTTNGACHWSVFAIDSLLENATSVCTATHIEEFFLEPEWNVYRFSDYLNGVQREGVGELPQTFPKSLVAEMNPNVTRRTDIEANRVVASRIARMPLKDRLEPGTLVIHLRLGDVVEGAVLHLVQDLLHEQQYFYRERDNGNGQQCNPWSQRCMHNLPIQMEGKKYVKSLSYYSSLEDLDQFQSFIILGAAHTGHYKRTATKSCHYTAALQAYFKRRMPHAKITLKLGSFPDEYILVAAQASRFVRGGGGFSLRLANINAYIQERMAEGKLEPEVPAPKQPIASTTSSGGLRASETKKRAKSKKSSKKASTKSKKTKKAKKAANKAAKKTKKGRKKL